MRHLSIAEIKALDNKEPIPSFQGRITHVWDQKTDHGDYGQWWLQNLDVEDETGTVKVAWGGEDAFDEGCVGKIYHFECTETKHGLRGVAWEAKKKGGKTYENVKVTPTAKIRLVDPATEYPLRTTPADPDQELEKSYARQQSIKDKGLHGGADPDWPEAPVKESERAVQRFLDNVHEKTEQMKSGGVQEAREHLMKAANLYNLCVACVEKAISPTIPQIGQTSEMFQAAVGTLFIEASRAGYVSKMPSKPL